MDLNDLHPPDDYSTRFFIWHEWIQVNGPLTAENVFEYFATSMFYDKQSNNQVLRMQTIHTGVPLVNEAEELKRFTGVEFAVVHAQPPSLFIIHKRERLSPDEVRPLAAYFIMNNRIYQSPEVYTVLSNRLLTSLFALQSSLDVLRAHRPEFMPRTGFVWPIIDSSLSDEPHKKRTADDDTSETGRSSPDNLFEKKPVPSVEAPKRQQNTVLLYNAMRATAHHSKLALSSSFTNNAGMLTQETSRSSATPGPQDIKTPAAAELSQDPPSKSGGTKKKRKRTLQAT